jgi:hypothetical protein
MKDLHDLVVYTTRMFKDRFWLTIDATEKPPHLATGVMSEGESLTSAKQFLCQNRQLRAVTLNSIHTKHDIIGLERCLQKALKRSSTGNRPFVRIHNSTEAFIGSSQFNVTMPILHSAVVRLVRSVLLASLASMAWWQL